MYKLKECKIYSTYITPKFYSTRFEECDVDVDVGWNQHTDHGRGQQAS